ncbi:hypothetical protein [Asanoa iriomotensis]|uniref:Uncharacterized protein n=1 Tax=Asanoa iriomotensis TaxID=234613 RepID=A0ABQ4CFW5_9ACTN|nr:hypothetical protein [Asanoa iriomotensis]GIF61665.1 hypothetical protein Air01nite_77600 [Asanoa iriomotensis]
MVELVPKMEPEAPEGYVSFVDRHLAALRSESARLAGDAWRAEEIYPDVLTSVAARWRWLELLATRFGRPAAADDYLRQVLAERARRWRAEQIYEVEMVVLRADPADPAESAEPAGIAGGGSPRSADRGWSGLAAGGSPGSPAAHASGLAVSSAGLSGAGSPARATGSVSDSMSARGGRPRADRPAPFAGAAVGGSTASAIFGRSAAAMIFGRSAAGSSTEGATVLVDAGTRMPRAPFAGPAAVEASAGLARYRRTAPGRSSLGLKQARFLSPLRRPPAPIAEAAIAWWHAYVAQRRRKRVAIVIALILLVAALTNLRATNRI